MKKRLLFAFIGLFIWACQSQKPLSVSDEIIQFKIIQINDVYEIDAISAGKVGGLARVASIRDSVKKVEPNTFYFLAGDFVNPSLLGTIKVDGERLQGKQMIEVLNASELDLVTFGNHEFDVKENDLQNRLNESNFKWTSGNVRQVTPNGYQPFKIVNDQRNEEVSDYEIFEVQNASGHSLRFGIISVTLPSNPKPYVHYGDIYDEMERIYHQAKAESDLVIGMTHVSLEQDIEIAKRLPEIPLIMGGHEHFNMVVEEGKTMITKADANVASLFVHTFQYNTRTKELTFDSELVKVTDRHRAKPEVQVVVDKWNAVLDQNLKTIIANPDQVVYIADEPLDGTDVASRSIQTNLGGIITEAMFKSYDSKADLAITNGGGIRIDDRLQGDITAKDVFRILPFGGKVLKVDMTGELLTDVLNFGWHANGTGAYLQHHLVSRDAQGQWLVQGKPIDKNKQYAVVLNDFLLEGLDIPFLTKESPGIQSIYFPEEEELAFDIRKAIIQFFEK